MISLFVFNTFSNILFILIDSLRGDYCYSESKSCSTPNLDSMINNRIYFNQAIISADYTISRHGSIFTSLYPYNANKKGVSYHKLFSKVPNYITHLKKFRVFNICYNGFKFF